MSNFFERAGDPLFRREPGRLVFSAMSPEERVIAEATLVDLFAGPGGLDVAAKWLGVSAVGVELDPNACATRRAAKLATVEGDVRSYGPENFPAAVHLAAGPPCQTFSVAGAGAGRKALDAVLAGVEQLAAGHPLDPALVSASDERTALVLEPLRWALAAIELGRPFESIVLEQVPSVLPVWRAVGDVLGRYGYECAIGVLCAEEYGIPQTRRRAVLIARQDRQPVLPAPTHARFRRGASDAVTSSLPRWQSMAAALGRDDKFVVVSNYGSGGDPEARGERRWDEPAFTVTGKVSRNKFRVGRKQVGNMTTEDAARLQTFPSKYPWSGKDIAQQVGNAIPPRLAAHVLAEALWGAAPVESDLNRAVFRRWTDNTRVRRAVVERPTDEQISMPDLVSVS